MELTSYAPSYTVKVSVCPHLGYRMDGKLKNPMTGQKLEIKTLKETVFSQLEIPETRKKGSSGCVFPFAYDTLYSINDPNIDFKSSGVVFVDLDHVTEQETVNLINSFDRLTTYLPDLICMHLSHSGKGFHLYFISQELSPEDYAKFEIAACLRVNKAYEKIFSQMLSNEIFDSHQVSIKQRFYLNLPYNREILWNDNASICSYTESDLTDFINHCIDYYDIKDENGHSKSTIYTKWKSLNFKYDHQSEYEDFQSDISVSRKNKDVSHLSHIERMWLYSSLRVVFKDNFAAIKREWEYCMRHMEFLPSHKTQLGDALIEPDSNPSWKTYPTPHISKVLFLFYDTNEKTESKQTNKEKSIIINEVENTKLSSSKKSLIKKYACR